MNIRELQYEFNAYFTWLLIIVGSICFAIWTNTITGGVFVFCVLTLLNRRD